MESMTLLERYLSVDFPLPNKENAEFSNVSVVFREVKRPERANFDRFRA
ncbi:hypothetical protein OAK47_02300 [Planctomycetaceae bacterium]|nr:hypothetical protein [Planctomycetaceae bacterium]